LLLESPHEGAKPQVGGAVLYFDCPDMAVAVRELKAKGVTFAHPPHLITRQPAYDLYMAFFADPDGNMLALSQRAPKDYIPPKS
jgi:hypothetical protein